MAYLSGEVVCIKRRIFLGGNHDRMKKVLKTDTNSCLSVGLRVLCTIVTSITCPISNVDFDSRFLQSGVVTRDVYMRPPNECTSRCKFLWLLRSASYGLVNANSTYQAANDVCLY